MNQIDHQRGLASVNSPGVIKPNVDTVYSRVVLDLSTNDLVLTIPEINDRYWVYPVYDPFGNVIYEIGVVNGDKAGDYLLRRAEDVYAKPGFERSTPSHNSSTEYQGIVNLPSTYGTMLLRILVLQNTTSDLNQIHQYQNATKLTAIPRNASQSSAPALKSLAPNNASFLGISSLPEQLDFAARLLPYNQPPVAPTERFRVASILSQAGLYDGNYSPLPDINFTRAGAIANSSITTAINLPVAMRNTSNGWSVQTPSHQGFYGEEYASAAYVALGGYQQLTQRQALYPVFEDRGFSSAFTLEDGKALLFTFSGKPHLQRFGFWSLTVYGASGYLIPNPLGRFEIGDRTHGMVYENGDGVVYGDDANDDIDGEFQILLQAVDAKPPRNWTSNWLPVEREFSLIREFCKFLYEETVQS